MNRKEAIRKAALGVNYARVLGANDGLGDHQALVTLGDLVGALGADRSALATPSGH